MLRKPDPPVLVAVTMEPPGWIKTSTMQILNLNWWVSHPSSRTGTLDLDLIGRFETIRKTADSLKDPGILGTMSDPNADGLDLQNTSTSDPDADE